jgi:selenide,water dikinase
MTDVTGFGLAGHLAGMCEASGVGATVNLGAVPMMQGALTLASAGVRSSLFDENKAGVVGLTTPDSPLADLMFDPQTAGGLLAAVDAGQVADLCAALLDAGYPAAIIGEMTAGTGVTLTD